MNLALLGSDPLAIGFDPSSLFKEALVKELARYLFSKIDIDFQGDITTEKIREFLRDDESREARRVMAKLIEDKGVDDLLITLADCLRDQLRNGISEDTVRDQIRIYSDS